jgi:hypothetical protein
MPRDFVHGRITQHINTRSKSRSLESRSHNITPDTKSRKFKSRGKNITLDTWSHRRNISQFNNLAGRESRPSFSFRDFCPAGFSVGRFCGIPMYPA